MSGLRGVSDAELLAAIEAAVAELASSAETLGARTGLSIEGTRWALDTTLAVLAPVHLGAALEELRALDAAPVGSHGLVLAGNVFTAGLRPVVWSLLARVPVRVKLASSDAGLVELFRAALVRASPAVGDAVSLARFSRETPERYDELAESVDVISVHGSDRTIEALRARTPSEKVFVAHGHGLGLAVIARGVEVTEALVDALAIDVAAYDQQGCLSPAAVLVEEGGVFSPAAFAGMLDAALVRIERSMPRGLLPVEVGAAQVQWRGVAAGLHTLYEGVAHAVSYEGASAIRSSPGHRNIAVHALADLRKLPARVALYGEHLKSLGVAGDVLVPATVAPIVSGLGEMQRPPLAAYTDGVPPWTGLVIER